MNKEYQAMRRNDPRHLDIDWVLNEWDKNKVYVNNGYIQTEIHSRTYYVHQLVMMEKIHGFIPAHLEVNHIDRNRSNNNIDNLELLTHRQNMHHSINLGHSPGRKRIYTSEQARLNKKELLKAWKKSNPEKVAISVRRWQAKNKEKMAEYSRKYYQKNKAKAKEQP